MDHVLIAIRAIHLVSTVMAVGAILFRFLVAEPTFRLPGASPFTVMPLRAQLAGLAWIALAIVILSGAAWLVWLAVTLSGQTLSEALSGESVLEVLTETQFGHAWTARLAIAIFLAGTLLLLSPKAGRHSPWLERVAMSLAGCLIAAVAWAGHGGATPGPRGNLHLISDAVHLIAAGAWMGGLLPLVLVFAFTRRAADQISVSVAAATSRRFSMLGMTSVGALLATGIINASFLISNLPDLAQTDYGRLLLLKITLFIAMVCIAAINRFRMLPRLSDVDAIRKLQRNSLIETALGLIVVVVVSVLGTIPPAAHIHAGPHVH